MALVLPPEPMWNSSMSSTSPLTSSLSSNLPGSFLTSLSPLSFCLCLRRQIIYCSLLLTYWMPTAIWTIPPSILSHVRMPALPPGFTSASVLKMRLEGWTRRCQPSGNRILNLAFHPPAFVFSTSFFDIYTRSNAILSHLPLSTHVFFLHGPLSAWFHRLLRSYLFLCTFLSTECTACFSTYTLTAIIRKPNSPSRRSRDSLAPHLSSWVLST